MHKKFAEMLARRYIEVHHTLGADAAIKLAERTVGDDEDDKEQVSACIKQLMEETKR